MARSQRNKYPKNKKTNKLVLVLAGVFVVTVSFMVLFSETYVCKQDRKGVLPVLSLSLNKEPCVLEVDIDQHSSIYLIKNEMPFMVHLFFQKEKNVVARFPNGRKLLGIIYTCIPYGKYIRWEDADNSKAYWGCITQQTNN